MLEQPGVEGPRRLAQTLGAAFRDPGVHEARKALHVLRRLRMLATDCWPFAKKSAELRSGSYAVSPCQIPPSPCQWASLQWSCHAGAWSTNEGDP